MEVVVAYSKIPCICVNGFGFPVVVQEYDLIKRPNERPNRVPFDCDMGRPGIQFTAVGPMRLIFYIELGCGGDTKMYKTVILPVGFYAFKTWSLALSERQRLSVREYLDMRGSK
jgi:hypothetical protein